MCDSLVDQPDSALDVRVAKGMVSDCSVWLHWPSELDMFIRLNKPAWCDGWLDWVGSRVSNLGAVVGEGCCWAIATMVHRWLPVIIPLGCWEHLPKEDGRQDVGSGDRERLIILGCWALANSLELWRDVNWWFRRCRCGWCP